MIPQSVPVKSEAIDLDNETSPQDSQIAMDDFWMNDQKW
jgi:hypothetical protein